MKHLIIFLIWVVSTGPLMLAQEKINRQEAKEAKNTELPRKETSLNGEWRFRRDDQKEWKTVTLPTHWETHEGLKFDGVGWYEKTLEPITLAKGRRLLLHFDAVATQATVYWNDVKLGEHLGAWTPFRFDVTEQIRKLPTGKHTIKVRVDEKIGHNTQGFLPIIEPHFGGIWQGVKLIEVSNYRFDDESVVVSIDPKESKIKITAETLGALPWDPFGPGKESDMLGPSQVQLSWRVIGEPWRTKTLTSRTATTGAGFSKYYELGGGNECFVRLNGSGEKYFITSEIKLDQIKPWSPSSPTIYEIRLALNSDKPASEQDILQQKVAFRTIETKGDQFLLNGQPLSIRGVLNWGYYPPSLSPNPPEDVWRSDLKLIKSWGFNLMKCCLWVPPQRLLEIADEEGVLIWLEYPTWHPQLTPKYEAELLREYKEFHQHDRNHPSVILRSLTCETGSGADLGVIKKLYDQCKQMCGGLVVDDSSWIEWNRICDFYDDHPYGNNHTWVKTLTRLKDYIAHSKLGVKPLCLGEAIAADTWVPSKPMLEAIAKAKADPKQAWSLDERGYPYWVPGFFDANQAWLKRMEKVCGGPIYETRLFFDSLEYAESMRKYQIQTYRRLVPNGGYVVSVIRDFPLASMGLIDFHNKPKTILLSAKDDPVELSAAHWVWHAEHMLVPVTKDNRHCFEAGSKFLDMWYLITTGSDLPPLSKVAKGLIYHVGRDSQPLYFKAEPTLRFDPKKPVQIVQSEEIVLPKTDSQPTPFLNTWIVRGNKGDEVIGLGNHLSGWIVPEIHSTATGNKVEIISKITDGALKRLEQGASILLLPDGKSGSLQLQPQWFLRGGPFVNDQHPLIKENKNLHGLLTELQHFDLASDVIPDINYLEEIDPILMLWDNHDIKEVKTHGLVFETRVGKGRLLVSALNHQGETNAAGKWLLDVFLKHLDSGPPPRNALKPETIARMRAKLNEKRLDLVARSWQFMPDGKEEGLKLGWHKPGFDDKAWKPIKIGKHWEAQGYPDLDGWAWYRLKVDIPKDWAGMPIYLNSEGVDDAYEIFLNGSKIGSGGDIPNKKTAFEERKAHPIPANVLKPGESNVIAIRVYDWYGSGGIHRPMTLSNMPIGGVDILK